jgi:methyl-accepting chemotaxis protein
MFPKAFHARVGQRLAIWGAMLGFLVLLLTGSEVIRGWQDAEIAADRQRATAAALAFATGKAVTAPGDKAKSGKDLIGAIAAIDERQRSLAASHTQNKTLLLLLALFLVGEILVLEYRWLIKPIMRLAWMLRSGGAPELHVYTARRDEIGSFAQALAGHFALVTEQQTVARAERIKLSDRVHRQEHFRRESVSFQKRIGDIVRQLESHADRMSAASQVLVTTSADAQTRAGASAESTVRVSGHVDIVAASIRDIATTLSSAAEEAERTSRVAASARATVEAAQDDAKALAESARTIAQVVALIEEVAQQTNLLALNATIEAARAGEAGRGFGIVAQEVKQLAMRTSQATDDVRARLQAVTGASGRIGDRVATLVGTIEQVTEVVGAIAQSMRTQDVNSQTITANTGQTAADVREVAAAVKGVAAMIGQAKDSADLVTKVSTDLGQQAADLRGAVERFIETTERIAV